MGNEKKTCQGCYWEDQCGGAEACTDYTPINDDSADVDFYYNVLRENAQEYEELVREQNG